MTDLGDNISALIAFVAVLLFWLAFLYMIIRK